MPAAAARPTATRYGRSENMIATPHLAAADNTGLLDALPIAAAVIELGKDRSFAVAAHNSRFIDLVERSNCTALNWNEAHCLKNGPIADLLRKFFDGSDVAAACADTCRAPAAGSNADNRCTRGRKPWGIQFQ